MNTLFTLMTNSLLPKPARTKFQGVSVRVLMFQVMIFLPSWPLPMPEA